MTRRNNANATQNENSIVQLHSDQDIIDYLSCASPATKEKLREEAQISRKPITERHVRSLVISEMETNKKEMENKIADGIENFSTSILAFIEVRLNDLERTSSCHNESFVIEHATRLFVRSVNLTVVQIPNLWPPLHRILPVSFAR
ncbi:hypothetical protein BWQ96_10932 [Gracilariopsis chorda]|uniref:Uncharacterized protein n=1 Tax=Gracilariopsis chorda TaxID=448386 RepID=A0A2V3IB42_9FLOR|nr:hypothetical protein BWQ96_10932 [Gracilariopsis chorda]|eukprot:PXF39387.1 hypothetical protein BWQ96_10932 [Gracilariopsis chorda]